MNRTHFILVLVYLAAGSVGTRRLEAAGLDQVISSMDQAAASFTDMTAKLKRIDHTAVIDDTTVESGQIRMQRDKSGNVRMLIEFTAPDPRTVAFAERKAEIYYPKINTVQVYDLGKYKSLVDQFLLLGFGSSGRDLMKNYTFKLLGEERVSGEATNRIQLTPKTPEAREHLTRVELWISAAGYPLQQKFYRPSGDYTLVNYMNLQINPRLSQEDFKLKLPSGVKREFPQK